MAFQLGEPKPPEDAMYFERKPPPERADEYASEIAHKDLFDTISEVHYLPELGGPHDEELLESLVEKGCEDNQILVDQALDKLNHLVHGAGEYNVEDDMLLSNAPVSDIINRLEQTLESPGHSSITAAQGLLHLHHIGDHLSQADHRQAIEQSYMSQEVFVPEDASQCPMESLTAAANELQEMNEMNHIGEYDDSAEKRLDADVGDVHTMCAEQVPDSLETDSEKTYHELQSQALPDQSEINTPTQTSDDVTSNGCLQVCEQICGKPEDEQTMETNEEEAQRVTAEQTTQDNSNFDHDGEMANEDLLPTDLSIKNVEKSVAPLILPCDSDTPHLEDNVSVKSDEQPRDLTVHRRLPTPHASPRRTEVPRAPSRESDAMQSPQPSGIPAVPSSPEIFTMPLTKSKQTLFLETLLSSPSPKMYTSEVTITKQQCEPLNLGKHRKSASPTVSSCSDEMKKLNKEFGEPQEKKMRRESSEELAKVSKVFKTEDQIAKKPELKVVKSPMDETTPLKQLLALKSNPELNIPDPLLVPKDKLNSILVAPGREIPALLLQRPELRLPQAFAFPAVLQDPDILVVSLSQLETILENEELKSPSPKPPKDKEPKTVTSSKNSVSIEKSGTPLPDQTSQPKPIPSMDALAGDIDAATSAALNQMLWLPYLSQLEAMAACSQNMDFLKALNSAGYTGQNYPDLSQMFNHSNRFMGAGGFPMMPPMDYDNRLQFAMWQEAMSHANSQRSKQGAMAEQMKELSKSTDVQNPYVHSTKNHPSKTHSSARTSPIAHNYNNQRSMAHNPFLQGMYPGMNPNIRPNMPLPGLQIPYFNPQMMGNQRSPRTGQQKSPSSPYYPNNNYLQSVKQSESHNHQRSSSQESPRPRISVKSLHNLLEPSAAAASGVGSSRRGSATPTSVMGRRRDEPEVGSTTPLGEPPPHMPPHPHDPSSFHLWHPLFGNQKSYNSPWSWTTVTATGD
ncbi:uncharacterized protein LOC123872738 [Maniola jurtina]|uniref:uncharacterized protein LOC123872738 n=1 Tax=Maniola jurtina TaxID=191418 RepID=UPI001E688855|nr:uncharacterized protein LOC123872738 [Maniola jurtina]